MNEQSVLLRQLCEELDGLRNDLATQQHSLEANSAQLQTIRDFIAAVRHQVQQLRSNVQAPVFPLEAQRKTPNGNNLIYGEFDVLFAHLVAKDEKNRPNIRLAFPIPERAPKWLKKFDDLRQALNRSFHEGGELPVPSENRTIDLKRVDASNPALIKALERYILWETLGRVRFVSTLHRGQQTN